MRELVDGDVSSRHGGRNAHRNRPQLPPRNVSEDSGNSVCGNPIPSYIAEVTKLLEMLSSRTEQRPSGWMRTVRFLSIATQSSLVAAIGIAMIRSEDRVSVRDLATFFAGVAIAFIVNPAVH